MMGRLPGRLWEELSRKRGREGKGGAGLKGSKLTACNAKGGRGNFGWGGLRMRCRVQGDRGLIKRKVERACSKTMGWQLRAILKFVIEKLLYWRPEAGGRNGIARGPLKG